MSTDTRQEKRASQLNRTRYVLTDEARIRERAEARIEQSYAAPAEFFARYELVNRDTHEVVATYETRRAADYHAERYPNDYVRPVQP